MNSDAENQEVLKRILRAIELATKHHNFALYFVQCQLLTDQDNYINYLKEQCNEKGVELLKVDLSSKIIKNPREEILKELNYKFPSSKPDKLTISVTGLDASFLTDVDYESPAVLQILNMGREHYARDMPYPSIFWLPDYAITKIASGAPDFWAWRNGDVDELVSSEAAKRQAINDAVRLDEPTKWDEGLYQIILFERLIDGHPGSENGTDEQKREYRILQYRLGKAYHVLEMYPSAYQHYRKALEIGKGSGDLAQQGRELNALGLVCRSMGKSQKSLQYSHLFSIDVSTDAGLEEDLNKSIISEKLKHIFKNNRYSLFYNASVTKEKKDEWLITDEEKFLVKKEEGKLSIYKNFLEDSLKYFAKYFGLSVREKDKKGQGVALGNSGLVYRDVQQNENAIGYLKRALTINKGNRYRSGMSDNLGNLGLAYQEMGDFETAIEYHLKALKVSREIGDRESEIKDLANLGVVYNSQGKIKDAIGYYQQALELSQQSEDRPRERDLPIKIAHCFRELEELDEAQDYYEKAKKTCQEMGDDGNFCDVLIYQAELSAEFGKTQKEIDLYEEALTLSRKLRDEKKEFVCLKKLIPLHHREWDPDKAKNYIDDARKVLGNDLMAKPINVWLRDGFGRQPESLAIYQKYDICLKIGEPDIGYSPLRQTDFIFNLVSEREVPNKPIKPFPKPSTALEEEKEEIPQPIPETYDVEEKTIKVSETLRPRTISHIEETQPTRVTPGRQPRQYPSGLIHEELSKEMVEVSVCIQNSRAFEFDKRKGQLYVSWGVDSETIYFGITSVKIGKQSITIEGAANDIPFDLTINDIEVKEAVTTEDIIKKVRGLFYAEFYYTKDKEELTLTRTLPDSTPDTSPVNLEEIYRLEKLSRDLKWNKSRDLSRQIGEHLFTILNGDRQTLIRALKEAEGYGEQLQLIVKVDGPVSNLPFELLYHNDFLVPSQVDLIRQVSDRGMDKLGGEIARLESEAYRYDFTISPYGEVEMLIAKEDKEVRKGETANVKIKDVEVPANSIALPCPIMRHALGVVPSLASAGKPKGVDERWILDETIFLPIFDGMIKKGDLLCEIIVFYMAFERRIRMEAAEKWLRKRYRY